ncbi:hypothetical protein [Spirosoma agri]|uniref:Uncharacterized protein n=1 Tax=Spirosoma agri TaxID=1987381 RepID=A0A6M0IIT8_9BACT|nr:hypothetical protein [Spirosoma agri]NEU67752.1 hypothetical protein [Spirosoma agri]
MEEYKTGYAITSNQAGTFFYLDLDRDEAIEQFQKEVEVIPQEYRRGRIQEFTYRNKFSIDSSNRVHGI